MKTKHRHTLSVPVTVNNPWDKQSTVFSQGLYLQQKVAPMTTVHSIRGLSRAHCFLFLFFLNMPLDVTQKKCLIVSREAGSQGPIGLAQNTDLKVKK